MADRIQCPVCQRGFLFVRGPGQTGPRPTYCSLACRQWWTVHDVKMRRWAAGWQLRCSLCSLRLVQRGAAPPQRAANNRGRSSAMFCSKTCGSYTRGEGNITRDRCRVVWRECRRCTSEFIADYRTRKLCRPCRPASLRDTNRRKNTKRRGVIVPGAYTLADIGRRDGWRCHLCRRLVDGRLSGRDRMGPTIDHLVPISDGGTDTPENVALAHLSCNSARCTGGVAQLRLVG